MLSKENQIATLKNEKSLLLKEKAELSNLLRSELLQKDRAIKEKDDLSNQLTMQKLEHERLEREKLERERLERERLERERLERERLEQDKLGRERLEQERLGRERLERERLERERLERERLEREKLEQEKLERERLERERLERERLEREKLEREKLEQEKLEQSKFELSKQRLLSDVSNIDKPELKIIEENIHNTGFSDFDTSFPVSAEGFEPFDDGSSDFGVSGFDASAFVPTNFDNAVDKIQDYSEGFDSFDSDPFVVGSGLSTNEMVSSIESKAFEDSFRASKALNSFGPTEVAAFDEVISDPFTVNESSKATDTFNETRPSEYSDSFDSTAFQSSEGFTNTDPFTSADSFVDSNAFGNDPFLATKNIPLQNQTNADTSFETFNVNSFGDNDPFGENSTLPNNESFCTDNFDPFTTGAAVTGGNSGFDDFGSSINGNPFGDFTDPKSQNNNGNTDNDGFSSPW